MRHERRPASDARVAAGVRDGKVSWDGARDDYGVVFTGAGEAPQVNADATAYLRTSLQAGRRQRGPAPFFDRGPGYAALSGGAPHADVDMMR